MELLDYNCSWDSVTIHRRDDAGPSYEDTVTTTFEHPVEMFDWVLQQWTMYCPADANREFLNVIGEDICWVDTTNKGNTILEVDFHLKDAEKAFLKVRFNIKEEKSCN